MATGVTSTRNSTGRGAQRTQGHGRARSRARAAHVSSLRSLLRSRRQAHQQTQSIQSASSSAPPQPPPQSESESGSDSSNILSKLINHHKSKTSALALSAAVAISASTIVTTAAALPAYAKTDVAAVGTCLLGKCQKELARCVADEKCIESLVCLNTCSGRPDESDCQIKCGDLYNDAAVGAFNTCAVTEQKCVPQKQDDSTFPALDKARTVPNLATSNLEGRWYIVAGLNPLFDTFDCQVHYFSAPKEGELYGKINWRVRRPNGDFYERSDIQTFVADPQAPAVLYNHDNEFLHYEDDWYIVDSNDDYFVVYYRGQNDAWVGYGGAVVYAREPSLRPEWVPRLREVVKTKMSNIDGATRSIRWEDFKITDNTCAPRPTIPRIVAPSDLDTLGADVVALEKDFVGDVVAIEREVGRDVVAIEREIVKDVRSVEDGLVSFGSRFTLLNNKSVVGADSASPQQKQQDVPASVRRSLNKVEARYESSIEGAEGGGFSWNDSVGPVVNFFKSIVS